MILIPIKNGKLNMLITFIIGNILECISYKILGYHFDLYSAAIGSYTLYYLTAIFQINWLVLLFKKLKPTKLIHYIGKNSLVYYALHAQIFVTFDKILKNIVYVYIHGLIKLSVTIIILTIISIIINKYFPFIVGKKRCNNDI
jgi:fucose 4-O-acetylase-like acetyltransferase